MNKRGVVCQKFRQVYVRLYARNAVFERNLISMRDRAVMLTTLKVLDFSVKRDTSPCVDGVKLLFTWFTSCWCWYSSVTIETACIYDAQCAVHYSSTFYPLVFILKYCQNDVNVFIKIPQQLMLQQTFIVTVLFSRKRSVYFLTLIFLVFKTPF